MIEPSAPGRRAGDAAELRLRAQRGGARAHPRRPTLGLPIEALADPVVWYDAVGDAGRLESHRRRMLESVLAFLAVDRVESHPMSEYVFADAR